MFHLISRYVFQNVEYLLVHFNAGLNNFQMHFIFFQGSATTFGGYFKEALTIACLSKRCFEIVTDIMTERKRLKLKINRGLFAAVPGLCNEQALFTLLLALKSGHISQKDFNRGVCSIKVFYSSYYYRIVLH